MCVCVKVYKYKSIQMHVYIVKVYNHNGKNSHPPGNGVNSRKEKTVLQTYLQYSLFFKSHPLRQTMRSKLFS